MRMRKILLSSSQASVLLSGSIVLLCTLALFLSGYAIQQRTLRDLREAIRPRQIKPSPRAYLPEHFRTTTQKLKDGSTITVESAAEREAREMRAAKVEVRLTAADGEGRRDNVEVSAEQRALVDALKAQVAEKMWMVENPDPLSKSRIPVTAAQRRQMIRDTLGASARSNEPVYHPRGRGL